MNKPEDNIRKYSVTRATEGDFPSAMKILGPEYWSHIREVQTGFTLGNDLIGKIYSGAGAIQSGSPYLMAAAGLSLLGGSTGLLGKGGVFGSSIAAGLGGFGIGQITGSLTGNAVTGGLLGGIGGSILGPIGILGGVLGGIFGGRSSRRKRRREEQMQANLIEEQIEGANRALDSLTAGMDAIASQLAELRNQRDINLDIISTNMTEAHRVYEGKNNALKMQLNKLLATQRVQLSDRGTGRGGSGWFILGETADMGIKSQQELRFSLEAEIKKQRLQRESLLSNFNIMERDLMYSAYSIGLQQRTIKSELGRRIDVLKENPYAKEASLSKARTLMSLGNAIQHSRPESFSANSLLPYGAF
jgi:hypothetical protein